MDQVYALVKLIEQHTEDDRENFKVIRAFCEKIDSNVTSLLETRAQAKGATTAFVWVVGILSAVLGGSFATGLAYALPFVFKH